MNKITSNQYYGIGQVIMKVMQKKNIERINIYENSEFRSKVKTFGINWSAIGTVDIETTNKFINDLGEATKIIKYINKKEYYGVLKRFRKWINKSVKNKRVGNHPTK